MSPGSDDDTISSPRKSSGRYGGSSQHSDNKLSPKSPRSDPSDGSLPRFNQRPNNARYENYDDDRITPRSSRSASDKEDFNAMNMLSTMKKPLNDSIAFNKSLLFFFI